MGSIEVRLLGRLQVRRADGTMVDNAEWRTGKTADLVRLLTLAAGRPVRVESLLESLWPGAEETKARASLRTATSQIRRTLDADCIERSFDGLALTGVWSDVESFLSLADAARARSREGDKAQVVRLAREAEALFGGDVDCSLANEPDWVLAAREGVCSARRDLLTDAAECALQLHWFRDAVELAQRAHQADPMAERPHRLLMSAYAGLGETDRALRTYEQCRHVLAEELGVDPSPVTQAVHARILAGARAPLPADTCPPPRSTVESVHAALVAAAAQPGLHLVALRGAEAPLLAAALTSAGDKLTSAGWTVRPWRAAVLTDHASPDEAADGPVLVTTCALDELDRARLCAIVDTYRDRSDRGPVVVAVPGGFRAEHVEALVELSVHVVEHEIVPLDHASLTSVAEDLLGGPVTHTLVERLYAASGGHFSRAAATIQGWRGEGRIVSTTRGLDLTAPFSSEGPSTRAWLPLHRLTWEDAELAAVVAALRTVAGVGRIVAALRVLRRPADLATVLGGLDRLVDAQVLRLGDYGYDFVDPLMRDAAECWLRPAVRSRVHRDLAASDLLGPEDRAQQWTLAGEPVLAIQCLLDATELAVEANDRERATALVGRAAACAAVGSWDPRTQAETLEKVSHAAGRLGCHELARRCLDRGLEVAGACDRELAVRLRWLREAVDRPQLLPVQTVSREDRRASGARTLLPAVARVAQ
ncbi:MAG TPA: BTAD domain-containing putative transcriptional regulator [Nocardioides sp.]|nr:BTAD domain-containing putative transcriptional regulator [Nocardioides sp.]